MVPSSPRARTRGDRGDHAPTVAFANEPIDVRLVDASARARSRSTADAAASSSSSRRMSMPQQRQGSVVRSPSNARGRAASTLAMGYDHRDGGGGGGAEWADAAADGDEDEDEDDRVHNLTLDGVKQGPYMICKRSDDLLGHHARQVFREKAAAMRGENSIYYYLKELMKKFGSDKIQKKGLSSIQITLTTHEFRKLVASDAAFQSAIPEEYIDALFHRMVVDDSKVVRHLEFVEFCLFDHHQLRLLLFKFRRKLKKMRLTDNEITDTFRRLTSSGASSVSSEMLHAAITRELDVVLTTGELRYLLHLLDLDGDGSVKVNDFESFVKDDRASFDLVHPPAEHGVVDLKITMNEVDEASQKRRGFRQLHPAFHEESNVKVHLWYKTAPRDEGKSAISNIRYASTSRDSDLVSKGYLCLQQDINRNGAFGKHKYIWLSYVPANVQNVSEVIDLCLSSGDQDDAKDAKLWLPMHRGFKLVLGDLNERSTKLGVFLWIRRRQIHSVEDLVDTTHDLLAPESPRTRSKRQMHVDELETYVRQMLRRNCPVEQDGSINFARLFDEFDPKKVRAIGKQAMVAGIESFGIKMEVKDIPLVWDRINPRASKTVDVTTFATFMELTDSEIDDVVNMLQRTMTTKTSQQQQLPNYRVIFQSHTSLGDGRLSRSDFQRLLAMNQINFTNTELSKIIQRLDVNKDGVVDYYDFLDYVTGVCDAAQRSAQRVASAADDLKTWAMEKQNKKFAKDGQIDSSASWKLLRPKRGIVDVSAIERTLRERNIRLDSEKLRLLRIVISPTTNGEISQAAYHAFVNHQPRKISSMVYDLKKVVGPVPDDRQPDGVYDRLNVEGNGRLSLANFAREVNVVSSEKCSGVGPFDLKDFVYVVQWTGADCGGNGAVLVDRFLAGIRENNERRNMKHEFITNFDSPMFVEGVRLLREEMRRCAKTPDGKFDFRVPFRSFDKDKSGQIVLSEFEARIRELGMDENLSDREVKSLMRRFDLNSSGAISYEEFLRFNLVEPTSKSGSQFAKIEPILQSILEHERLTPATVGAFCSSLKRMFSILDKDTVGGVTVQQFAQTLQEMGLVLDNEELEALAQMFGSEDGTVMYGDFCDALQQVCDQLQREVDPLAIANEPVDLLELLCGIYREYKIVQRSQVEAGVPPLDMAKMFGFSAGDKQRNIHLSCDELRDVLWKCGVCHTSRDLLESILRCFRSNDGGFSTSAFCNFMDRGPSVLFHGSGDGDANSGALDGHILRLHEAVQAYMASGGGDADERLFQFFHELDGDGNGAISKEEFIHVLQKAGLRQFLRQDDEMLLLQFLDADGDGMISYREFVDFARHGHEMLNLKGQQSYEEGKEDVSVGTKTRSPPRSPGPSPPRSPRLLPPSTSARPALPTSSGSSRASSNLLLLVAKLNGKLRPSFPFDKYFQKYRISAMLSREPLVKSRVFEKIMDKFLARLIEHNVAYNMQEMDADSLTRAYESVSARLDGGSVVNFEAFCIDLKIAQSRAATQSRFHDGYASDSSGNGDGDLSCSSDEGESKNKRLIKVGSLIVECIRRDFSTRHQQDALRAKVKTALIEMDKGRKDSKAGENRVFKVLVKLGIRLKKKDAEALLVFLANSEKNDVYDVKKMCRLIDEQLGTLLGDAMKTEHAASIEAASTTTINESRGISTQLADKLYRCFITAAQQNISGRKLLEKCDTRRCGEVATSELQTVLRLIGCVLSDGELSEIKGAFSGGTNATINYRLLVRELTVQMKPPPTSSSSMMQDHRPASIQITPMPPAAKSIDLYHPQTPPSNTSTLPPRRPLTSSDVNRLDRLLCPYFQDLLTTRRLDTKSLIKSFEPYDLKSTGFVAPEAVRSVLRKYDVWPTDELINNILARYTVISTGRFDYIEFSTSLGSGSSSASSGFGEAWKCDTNRRVEGVILGRNPHFDDTAHAKNTKLPTLDLTPASETPDAHSLTQPMSRRALGWSCPVCLHTQSQASSTKCEICGAQNPSSVHSETLLQCSACSFRNRAGATSCDLCQLSLTGEFAHSGSPHKATSNKPANIRLQINTSTAAPSYDEGWVA